MAKKYYWFKMKDDFFKSKEIKKLRKIAGGDTYTIIYQKLILLSIKTNGSILYDEVEETFLEEISLEIDEDIENVRITMAYLLKVNLIDEIRDNELVVMQAISNLGSETDSAERVRAHRENKKQLALQCNTQVTKCNTEIELKKEKDKRDIITPILDATETLNMYCYNRFNKELRKSKQSLDSEYNEISEYIFSAFLDEYIKDYDKCNIDYINSIVRKLLCFEV